MKLELEFPFETKVKDKLSGFQGVITGYCKYSVGLEQYQITGRSMDHGEPAEYWVSSNRIQKDD